MAQGATMTGEALTRDPGDEEIRPWQEALTANMIVVGDALDSWGEMLASNVRLRMVEGDEKYMPLPTHKYCNDGMIEVTCNTDVFRYWLNLFSGNSDMSPRDVQDLYLASAAVSVDLAYLGITAKKERKYGNGTDTRNRAMERARDITHKFQDKKELVQSAQALEARMGVAGAVSAVEEISSSEVVEINWTRYSLGAAVYALGYDELKQRSVVGVFRAGILTEMGRYEETMLDFLDELQRPESYVNLQSNMDMIRRHSFPLFLFAGTMPMGYKGNH